MALVKPARRRSPQEKKQDSLEKDGRNNFGQNDKASRRLIPLQKKAANKKVRTADKVDLATAPDDIEARSKKRRVARWRKSPDQSLEAHLEARRKSADSRKGGRIARRKAADDYDE